jgi:hypothetical protein
MPGDENVKPSTNPEVDDANKSEILVVVEEPKEEPKETNTVKKKISVYAAQKKWEALQPPKPIVALPLPAKTHESPLNPVNPKDRGVSISESKEKVLLDDSDSESGPNKDIPAKIPSHRSKTNVTLSPTSPKSPVSSKGLSKRTGSGHFPGRLAGSGSKLREPVKV